MNAHIPTRIDTEVTGSCTWPSRANSAGLDSLHYSPEFVLTIYDHLTGIGQVLRIPLGSAVIVT